MIDFYSVPTSNGQKIAILLEEMSLEYKLIMIEREKGQLPNKDYLKINPIGKYPAIIDNFVDNNESKSIIIFETQAIALYLTDKTNLLLPKKIDDRNNAHIWSSAISSGLTPLLGTQYFIQYRAKKDLSEIHSWILNEIERYLNAFDLRLSNNRFLAGSDISYADVLTFPIMNNSLSRIPGCIDKHENIKRWIRMLIDRPAFKRGIEISSLNN
mgnify:CR=1 FL=1